jgi:hypothetical protein
MRRSLIAIAAFFALSCGLPARGDDRPEPPPATMIGGVAVQCRDGRGHDVPLMKVINLGDVGSAFIVNRVPVIAMDPHVMERLPEKLRIFFYQHECAHHALGHWYARPDDAETDADCWAVKRSRDLGLLTRAEIASFAPFLAQSRGSPWGHLPGPQRIAHMLQCFDHPQGG